ncbi:MAG: hypothetical protein HFI62_12675 [Lachnospiraceae bacterium]|nr:hypothetical protein [Lachnospiraceae bacterium]
MLCGGILRGWWGSGVEVLQDAVWRHAAQRVGQLCRGFVRCCVEASCADEGQLCRGSARCRVEACCVDSVKP